MARIVCEKYANVKPLEDFDWSIYEGGWNGVSLKTNKSFKASEGGKVFCHEKYAKSLYNKYFHKDAPVEDGVSKDLRSGDIINIKDVILLKNDELLISTASGGSAVVNLEKENQFIDLFRKPEVDRDEFKKQLFGTKNGIQEFLSGNFLAKIEKNGKASLYDGYIVMKEQEFKHQIELGDDATTAYEGKIIGANKGGYIMEIQGVKVFLPGSQATSNIVRDYESLIGTTTQVMMMKYIEGKGFLVSRKKYLKTIQPVMNEKLRQDFENEPNKVYKGTITGANHFGIFVELNEYYTGLLHKTYLMSEDVEKLKGTDENPDGNARMNFPAGTEIDVQIYSISDKGIVLTNIFDKEMRDVLVEQRTKEKEEEEARRAKEEAERKAQEEAREKKAMLNRSAKKFKGEVVSLEDLASKF